jgi:hypothetical protein
LLKDLTVAETAQYTASRVAVSRPVGEVVERAGITAIAGRLVGDRHPAGIHAEADLAPQRLPKR